MRIQMHDFSGQLFPAQLSRELVARGHFVDHVYSAQYRSGMEIRSGSGKGILERTAQDSGRLRFSPLTAGQPFEQYSPRGRSRFERSYAAVWKKHVRATAPDLVVAANMPLAALTAFRRAAARRKQPWLLWHQDLVSNAASGEPSRRLPAPIGGRAAVRRMEAGAVRSATHVVAVSEELRQTYRLWGLATDHVSVIPNWAPLDATMPRPRDNAWSAQHLPARPELRLLYAGTLGREHNPLLLAGLLRSALAAGLPARLIVASEGDGIEMLRQAVGREPGLPLTLLPFQPVEELPDMLGSADVLVTILEPRASRFSIPSQVLSSLAAGRPVLGLMPEGTPAAADIRAAGGFAGPLTDFGIAAGVGWLRRLHADPAAAQAVGAKGRGLAEARFGIGPITDRFEAVFRTAVPGIPEPAAQPETGAASRPRPAHASPPRGFLRKAS